MVTKLATKNKRILGLMSFTWSLRFIRFFQSSKNKLISQKNDNNIHCIVKHSFYIDADIKYKLSKTKSKLYAQRDYIGYQAYQTSFYPK